MLAASPKLAVHIRWMIRRDMQEVLAIDGAGFDPPWTEEEFLGHLRQRNCIGMVAEHGERIVGFFVYEMRKDRLSVTRLGVHPGFRRKGVGRQMLAKLAGKLSAHRRTGVETWVNEANMDALLWLKAHRYLCVDVDRERFGDDDGYLMRYEIETPDP